MNDAEQKALNEIRAAYEKLMELPITEETFVEEIIRKSKRWAAAVRSVDAVPHFNTSESVRIHEPG